MLFEVRVMGFIFGKNKSKSVPEESDTAPVPVKGRPAQRNPSSGTGTAVRQSRRVVAAKPAPGAKGTAEVRKGSARPPAPAAAPMEEPSLDELSLPEMRPPSTAPIKASAPPVFTGSFAKSGISRTGDAALLEFLVQHQVITADQALAAKAKAEAEQSPVDSAVVSVAGVTEEAIMSALSQARYYPHLQLEKYAIRKKALDTVPRDEAVRLSVLPVDKLGSLLQLAMVNPLDEETVSAIQSRTGLEVKRCIATRKELKAGLDKWYGGQVEAQDTSISFTADPTQETRSVTQVLGNVPLVAPAAPTIQADIAPEIQDIDDLLSADELVAPAIVEPIHLDEPPLVVPASEVLEMADAAPLALEPRSRRESVVAEVAQESSSDLVLDEVPITKPIARRPAAAPQAPAQQVFVQLIPVLEDEFKHAITHGKAHVFEKWVGLQTRNRIINAVPVDHLYDTVLSGLDRG